MQNGYFSEIEVIVWGVRGEMKLIKGWKRMSHEGGYVNEVTDQTLTIAKKEFSQDYHVLLCMEKQTSKEETKTISPDFQTQAKAEAYALSWMEKHPKGMS